MSFDSKELVARGTEQTTYPARPSLVSAQLIENTRDLVIFTTDVPHGIQDPEAPIQ